MGLVIGYNPRTKLFEIKDSAKNRGFAADGMNVGFLGATPTIRQTNTGTTSTIYSVTGDGSVNIASIDVALGAIQNKVNSIANVLAAFGLTT